MMPGAWNLQRRGGLDVGQRALAVDRLAQRVDHAAEEAVADGHREDLAGGLDGLALFDVVDLTEDHGADRVLVEVEREAQVPVLELEQLVDRGSRGGPTRRAMPSPTSITRPTWPTVRSGAKPSRFLRIAAVMSAVLMVSSAMWRAAWRRGRRRWPGARGPAVGDEQRHDRNGGGGRLAVEQVLDDLLAACQRDVGVGERCHAARRSPRTTWATRNSSSSTSARGPFGARDREESPRRRR
jgi:hypothetical protein